MYSIYFRTDGNQEIATGHLMRCLSIARACKKTALQQKLTADIRFLVSDPESAALLSERFDTPSIRDDSGRTLEFPIICLHTDYRKLTAELPELIRCLREEKIPDAPASPREADRRPIVFVDSYFATPEYFQALSAHCATAYLDDLRSFPCPVDLVINYDTEEPCRFYLPAARRLLGARYTPLREQFCAPPYTVRAEVGSILLSAGGTDPCAVVPELIRRIRQTFGPYLQLHVLTSKANCRYTELCQLAAQDSALRLHIQTADVAGLMSSCDLAVSAGGTTLCELCAVGVPSVSFVMADNQETAAALFAKEQLIPCAGDIRPDKLPSFSNTVTDHPACNPSVISAILQFLRDAAGDYDGRQKSSHAMRAFLDGCGAERIAAELYRLK